MNIPLINSNSKQDINTSLIAIRNAINELARVKESESVEDLQRQINIINQQIANFNSEFSAINTHLNTIDTNILNLQPVDTVASGNLHSVTSNAVANMNSLSMQWFWNDDPNVNMDVLEKAETMPVGKVSNFRVGGIYVKNSPYGTGNMNCDFIYTCYRIGDSNFTRLLGIDVRANHIYEKAKIANVWSDWIPIQHL